MQSSKLLGYSDGGYGRVRIFHFFLRKAHQGIEIADCDGLLHLLELGIRYLLLERKRAMREGQAGQALQADYETVIAVVN